MSSVTFSRRMDKHVTTVVVPCSRKCRCPVFVNVSYEINLYPVLSKLASYICEHGKLIVYSLYQKLWIWISICEVI